MPEKYRDYYEPFCGGAALFFKLTPQSSYLSDVNEKLVEVYSNVSTNPDRVIEFASQWQNNSDEYYRVRSLVFGCSIQRSAQFLYLSRHAFNGLYRLNQEGRFNVPYGHRPYRSSIDADLVRESSQILRNASVCSSDFEDVVARAQAGDFVYFDPPYAVEESKSFLRYNHKVFSWMDQRRLSALAGALKKRGCFVMVSGPDNEAFARLYSNFRAIPMKRNSSIAACSSRRKKITEYLFIGY